MKSAAQTRTAAKPACRAITLMLVLFILFPSPPALADDRGRVLFLRGTVTGTDDTGVPRLLRRNSRVYPQEKVTTGDNGTIQIVFPDRSMLQLESNSEIILEAYHFLPETPEKNRAISKVVKGSLRAITGVIGKQQPAAVRYKTPLANFGIRGTVLQIVVAESGNTQGIIDYGAGFLEPVDKATRLLLAAGERGQLSPASPQPVKDTIQRKPLDPARIAGRLVSAQQDTRELASSLCSQAPVEHLLLAAAIEGHVPEYQPDDLSDTVNGFAQCMPDDETAQLLTLLSYLYPDLAPRLMKSATEAGLNIAIALEATLRGLEHAPPSAVEQTLVMAISLGISQDAATRILENLRTEGVCQ